MKLKEYAPDPLNEQASVFVDAQTDIKTAIKQGALSGESRQLIKAKIKDIIDKAVARIRSPTLKEDGKISLMRFADRAYADFKIALNGISPLIISSVIILMRAVSEAGNNEKTYIPHGTVEITAAKRLAVYEGLKYSAYNKGLPLQEFQQKYMSRVTNALENLAQANALDPNDFTGRNSLRNLAEMQVRYERHQDEISDFQRGTRLVVCSVHADCSDRCSKWQGGVYSLDGSSGYTPDGRYYQPLENATDIYYTTKAGRTYKNGLLGFNCRHKLYEYKAGMVIPSVSEEVQRAEYAVTKRQREMERAVISAREQALVFKDTGSVVYRRNGKPVINKATGKPLTQYSKWKNIAQKRYAEYKQFSENHGRAYYPDRVKIL